MPKMRLIFIALLPCLVSSVTSQHSGNYEATRTALIPSARPKPTPPSDSFRIDPKKVSKEVNNFFKAYGWLRHNQTIGDSDIPRAIKKIQKAIRHPETGVYDAKLNRLMSRPRCGTEQAYNETAANEGLDVHKRYVLWGPKWDHSPITYQFENYTGDLDVASQRSIVSQAFSKWSSIISAQIVPAPANARGADIHIRFRSMGREETAYAYTNMVADGVTLASGMINITFNDDYSWNDDRLFNFTAVHEIGHALGLSHSTVEDAVMFAYYYQGLIRPLHPDDKAAIHKIYGWDTPRWNRIDSNPATQSVVQVSTNSDQPTAIDGLYQLRSTGQILSYTPQSNSWTALSTNKATVQIAGSNGILYQRQSDGSIYRTTSPPSSWQLIGAPSDNVLDMVAAASEIYARRKDGWIVRWSGTQQSWTTIQQPSTPPSSQVAVTDSKTLWNLLANGDLVRSEWPYTDAGWQVVDINPDNVQIAVGGDEFYKLERGGAVVWLDLEQYYWSTIEDNGSVEVFAVGEYVYSRHDDGSVWRYTGIPYVWELLDEERVSVGVVGQRDGSVYQVVKGGDVWKLNS